MATLKGNVKSVVNLSYNSGLDIGIGQHKIDLIKDIAFTSGTGANQINLLWSDQRTLAASTGEDLDLAGSLVDAFGNTLTFASIKMIYIFSAAANGDNLLVGGAASAAISTLFSDTSDEIIVAPGGTMLLVNPNAAGYAVTATTADLLRIENADSGAAATYDIIIAGDSA